MRIIALFVFVLLAAVCFLSGSPIALAFVPKPTQFVLPVFPQSTAVPTQTPIIITPTPTLPTSTPAFAEDKLYTVVENDTLSIIADKFGIPLQYLVDQNGIDRPNDIFPGEVIIIPIWPTFETKPDPGIIKIVVSLSKQTLDFYRNGVLVRTMLVSTGTWNHQTPTGDWQICGMHRYVYMTDNETYWLDNVPWDMNICNDQYDIHEGYFLHGTYWHHNFGNPMSHGCINLSTPDAYWIFKQVQVGQEVLIIN